MAGTPHDDMPRRKPTHGVEVPRKIKAPRYDPHII
jgi:hypothetical protein